MTAKERYRRFCKDEKSLPIFLQDWWLDAVCINGEWDVALYENEGRILAVWPYFIKSKYFIKKICVPSLAKFFGPYFTEELRLQTGGNVFKQKEELQKLYDQLPKVKVFEQYIVYEWTNHLPFYWLGFKSTLCYSFRINKYEKIDEIYLRFNNNLKRKLNTAKEKYTVLIEHSSEDFISGIQKFSTEKNIKSYYPLGPLKRLDSELQAKKLRFIFSAQNADGQSVAKLYCVIDNCQMWYLMSFVKDKEKEGSAMAYLVFEAIKFALNQNLDFDFEGSMIEGINKFYTSFGGEMKPYFFIKKHFLNFF